MKSPFEGLPREVAVLAAVALSVAVGFGVVAPAIPEFARSFGVGKTAAGAVISAFALMRFVFALAGGRLVDAFGERIILAVGIGIVAVSTGLAGLSQSYVQLLVLRGAGGVGSAMFTIAATALLFRVVGPTSRGRATGLFQTGFLIGGLLGPLVGGFLTDYSLRLPFYVYAVSLIVAGSIGAVFLAGTHTRPETAADGGGAGAAEPGEAADPASASSAADSAVGLDGSETDGGGATTETVTHVRSTSVKETWAHPAYRAAVVANFSVGWAFFGVRISLVPLFVTEAMGLRPIWTGVGFLCTSLAQAIFLVVSGRYVDRVGRRPAMLVGSLVSAAALGALALSTELWVYLVSMTVVGIGGAFLGTAPGAIVGDVMHGRGGRVVAVFQMASDLGAILGPLAAGLLADHVSFGAALAACAAVLLLATAMSVRMPETLVRA